VTIPASYTQDFDCGCQVEVDLGDTDVRTNLKTMTRWAEEAHKAAHEAAVTPFRFGPDIIVRASTLAVAS
jgi:hypothetical protein